MATIKYLGIEDSITSCDCCGKSALKHTVALEFPEGKRNYGVICAGNALGQKTRSSKDVSAAVGRHNELEKVKAEVDRLRAQGHDVVYGRFYVGRSHRTRVTVAPRSAQLVSIIYPTAV